MPLGTNRLIVGLDATGLAKATSLGWFSDCEYVTDDRPIASTVEPRSGGLPSHEFTLAIESPKLSTIYTSFGYSGNVTAASDTKINGILVKLDMFKWYIPSGIQVNATTTRYGRVGVSRVMMKGSASQVDTSATVALMAQPVSGSDFKNGTQPSLRTIPMWGGRTDNWGEANFLFSTNTQKMVDGKKMFVWNFDAADPFWDFYSGACLFLTPVIVEGERDVCSYPSYKQFGVSCFRNTEEKCGILTPEGKVDTSIFPYISIEFGFTPAEHVEHQTYRTAVPILTSEQTKKLFSFLQG